MAEELPGRLLDLWPYFLSYVVSLLVILSYWMAHHSVFSVIRGYDRKLIWLNSLFLMCVAFLPFPTALLGEYGNHQLVVAIYAASLAVTRMPLTALWWYASSGRRFVDADFDASTIKVFRIRGLTISLMFLASIAVSFFSVWLAISSWIFLIVVDLILLRVLRR